MVCNKSLTHRTEKQLFGSIEHVMFSTDADGSYVPAEDIKVFRIGGAHIHQSTNIGNLKDLASGAQDGLYVRIFNGVQWESFGLNARNQ